MRFDDRFLEELKARLRPSDVIGKTVKLRRQGREFVGLSPFNKEKSPSFFVNDEKGFFHDFSSGKHGDLISFLQETERLTFVEAVERLAAEAGLPLPEPDPQSQALARERQGLADWLETASAWFQQALRRPTGRAARDYLERRGLPASGWERFGLGFAPGGRTELKDYLIAKGALPRDLVAAGLLIAPEDGGAPYDRFRDRIIFPITDSRGRTISFGGRALDPNARAKYLNGPDTELFDKGAVLYGLPEARRLLHAGGEGAALVVVEGYMDVIACQRAGVAAVASMGTALTEAQMEQLWRLHPEPTLSFDGDAAGARAASRALDRALPLLGPGRSFRFVVLTASKDPDDILRTHGPAALKSQLADGRPFVEALFVRERDSGPLETPEQRAALKQRLRAAARSISDAELSAAYRDDLEGRAQALFAPAQIARPQRREPWRPRGAPPPPMPAGPLAKAAAKRLGSGLDPLLAALALGAVMEPSVIDDHLEALGDKGLRSPSLDALAAELVRLRISGEHLDTQGLRRHLAAVGFSALLSDVERAAAQSGAPFTRDDIPPVVAKSQWSRLFGAMDRVAALENALADLAGGGATPTFIALKTERDVLRRAIRTGTLWADEAPGETFS